MAQRQQSVDADQALKASRLQHAALIEELEQLQQRCDETTRQIAAKDKAIAELSKQQNGRLVALTAKVRGACDPLPRNTAVCGPNRSWVACVSARVAAQQRWPNAVRDRSTRERCSECDDGLAGPGAE